MQGIIFDELYHSENTKEYILSIQVSLGGFSFSIVSANDNRLLAWEKTPLTITNQWFLPRRFREWIQQKDILKKEFQKVQVVFDTNEFIPVPSQYFLESEKEKIIDTIIDIGNPIEIQNHPIESQNLQLLYTIPSQLKEILKEQFSSFELVHPLKNCLENLPQTDSVKNGLVLLFSSKYFYTVLYSDQKLLLANSFGVKHKNDIIFYTLSVLKQYQISPAETAVFLAGDIVDAAQFTEEIKSYFSHIQFLEPSKEIQINTNIFQEPMYNLYNLLSSFS